MPWLVSGSIHPPTVLNPEYTGPYIREDQVDSVATGLIGKPVYFEHYKPAGSIGTVKRVVRGPHREIIAILELHTESCELARQVVDWIKDSRLKGLSIGMNREITPNFDWYGDIFPTEVSIVSKGDYPETHIISHGNNKSLFVNLWGIHRISGMQYELPPEPGHTNKLVIDFKTHQVKMTTPTIEELNAALAKANETIAQKDAELQAARKELDADNAIDSRVADLAKMQMKQQLAECTPLFAEIAGPNNPEKIIELSEYVASEALKSEKTPVVELIFTTAKKYNQLAQMEKMHAAANANNPRATSTSGLPTNVQNMAPASIERPEGRRKRFRVDELIQSVTESQRELYNASQAGMVSMQMSAASNPAAAAAAVAGFVPAPPKKVAPTPVYDYDVLRQMALREPLKGTTEKIPEVKQ